jgi:hypothetical protein
MWIFFLKHNKSEKIVRDMYAESRGVYVCGKSDPPLFPFQVFRPPPHHLQIPASDFANCPEVVNTLPTFSTTCPLKTHKSVYKLFTACVQWISCWLGVGREEVKLTLLLHYAFYYNIITTYILLTILLRHIFYYNYLTNKSYITIMLQNRHILQICYILLFIIILLSIYYNYSLYIIIYM